MDAGAASGAAALWLRRNRSLPPEDSEIPSLGVVQGETAEPAPEEPADPNALTAEEIARVNEAFAPLFERENGSYMNPICSFFTSYYERPEDLDLVEFLRYFGLGEGPVGDDAEFEALKAAEGWPFSADRLDQMPVPVHKYSRRMWTPTWRSTAASPRRT